MRFVRKEPEPKAVAEVRCATTTDLSTASRARAAFDQLDKAVLRVQLAREQRRLCAFCMREIRETATDRRSEPTMKIAHRTPIAVDSNQALSWSNLLGSCDGGQRSGGEGYTCDAAQGSAALTVNPTDENSIAKLYYERRDGRTGLFITSKDPAIKSDVDEKEGHRHAKRPGTLALNTGDLPELREKALKAFRTLCKKRFPSGPYGSEGERRFFSEWIRRYSSGLPPFVDIIERKIGCRAP